MDSHAEILIVLHAHLPFVRHPEHEDHLEERWLYEAITECYLPLLEAFSRLEEDGIPYGIGLSFSPTLLAMLDDPLLRERYDRHLDRTLALLEVARSVAPFGSPTGPFGAAISLYDRRLKAA